ncbi:unnamed protein product [Cuscuta campestris]|uniref:Reverse transcriptase zinc-binding domain-containing protein n=1 Tax=Cuscuta campestris TaxID=132261 RepID=A0A484NKJ5_9ASTE|nr:unnamed protein product [Cuscuta campestris]
MARRVENEDPLVADFIDFDLNSWNVAKLEQYFDAGEVLQIRRVPINTRRSDGWFWIRDFRGAYTVKSAYRCLMGDASVVSSFSNWGRFWRIPVAPKVLVCLWRAIRGILPTRDALISKRVEVDGGCPLCGGALETVDHIFLFCPFADSVWRLMSKGGNRISFISFQNWFQVRCQNDTLLELRTVALTCWAIWKARNIAIWDHKTLHPGELKNMVSSMEAQWSNKTIAERERTPQRHEVSLRAEAYRCFFDAATSVSEESISFGCVLFDPGGAFVAAANGGKLGPLDPLLAEALACKETLSWLRNRGLWILWGGEGGWITVRLGSHYFFSRGWRPETHSFHLPFGEVGITLQDVEVLLGLPVDGIPLSGGTSRSRDQWIQICHDMMGFRPEPSDITSSTIKISAIDPQTLTEHSVEVDYQQHVRAIMFKLMGGSLFPNTTGNKVSLYLLEVIMGDSVLVRGHAIGAAVLSFLPRGIVPLEQLVNVPYGVRWVCYHRWSDCTTHSLRAYRDQLDRLLEGEFGALQRVPADVVYDRHLHNIKSMTMELGDNERHYLGVWEGRYAANVRMEFGMSDATPEYRQWYYLHGRTQIGNPAHQPGTGYVPISLELQTAIAIIALIQQQPVYNPSHIRRRADRRRDAPRVGVRRGGRGQRRLQVEGEEVNTPVDSPRMSQDEDATEDDYVESETHTPACTGEPSTSYTPRFEVPDPPQRMYRTSPVRERNSTKHNKKHQTNTYSSKDRPMTSFQVRLVAPLLLLVGSFCSTRIRVAGDSGDLNLLQRGQREFDYFKLALQWPGTGCNNTKKCCSSNGCCRSGAITGFTIHGLWAEYNDGTWPSCCQGSKFDSNEISSLLDDLNKYWSSYRCGSTTTCHGSKGPFWAHEVFCLLKKLA